MIITTQDIKQDYEIKGIVKFYYSGMYAKTQLGKQMSILEAIDYILNNFLSKQCEELGGDAIVGLNLNMFPAPGSMAVDSNILFYGTAVKLK